MSILIKDMKMPKNCTICRFCVPEADPGDGEMCMATGTYFPPCNTEHLENCPLVEVPTPHGRLIDADKLLKKGITLSWSVQKWMSEVDIGLMPTIIEAEEGEEA